MQKEKIVKKIVKSILWIMFIMLMTFAFISCEGPQGIPGDDGSDGKDTVLDLPPDNSAGSLDVTIAAIGSNLRGYDAAPSITIQASVRDSSGNYINGLRPADFYNVVDEDGVAMWPIDVQNIGGASAIPQVDYVYLIDVSGSMYYEIAAVKANIQAHANATIAGGIDARFGYVTFVENFGNSNYNERPYFAPTSDVTAFSSDIATLTTGNGYTENHIDAMDYVRAATGENTNYEGSFQDQAGFTYRAGAAKVIILITDEGYATPTSPGNVTSYYPGVANTMQEEITFLKRDNFTVYALTSSSTSQNYAEYVNLTVETGGLWFDVTADFTSIITTIGSAAVNNYVITYLTSNLTPGTTRNVRLAVNSSYGVGQDTGSYVFPTTVFSSSVRSLTGTPTLVVNVITGLLPTGSD